jgi:hypothetical protein
MISKEVGLIKLLLGLALGMPSWAAEEDEASDVAASAEETLSKAEASVEEDGCALVPTQALEALAAHYSAQAQWEARQQEWAEDWGAAVFRYAPDQTDCFPWGDNWILYAHGGSYSTKPMVERHRWSEGRLVNDGPSAPPLKVEMERDVPLLRIDTQEGCCDARWTQASWYTEVGGMHRVLSLPVEIDPQSSPWPVMSSAIWGGEEWSDVSESIEPLWISLRYSVPTLGNRETVLRGRLDGPGLEVEWTEPGNSSLVADFASCRKNRTPFCPLRVLGDWVNVQVGQAAPTLSGGSPRSVSQMSAFLRLESVVVDGVGQERAKATLRGKKNQILACYERATRNGTDLSGPLIVSMQVDAGRVSEVEINAAPAHTGFGQCLEKRLNRIRFPTVVEGMVFGTWVIGSP